MNRIRTVSEWRNLVQRSDEAPFLVVKYSLTCASSLSAKKELQKLKTVLPIYMVVVQSERELSNRIEFELGVKHESPQLLIIKNKKAIWQATHYHIKQKRVLEAIHSYV